MQNSLRNFRAKTEHTPAAADPERLKKTTDISILAGRISWHWPCLHRYFQVFHDSLPSPSLSISERAMYHFAIWSQITTTWGRSHIERHMPLNNMYERKTRHFDAGRGQSTLKAWIFQRNYWWGEVSCSSTVHRVGRPGGKLALSRMWVATRTA